jgi:hypothetical protein
MADFTIRYENGYMIITHATGVECRYSVEVLQQQVEGIDTELKDLQRLHDWFDEQIVNVNNSIINRIDTT